MKKHISKIIAATVSIGMLSSATPAPAQQVANLTPSTGNVEIVASAGNRLQLEVSKGRLVRLERPAATVFVADPEVANIQVKSPSLIYVLGKKPGETTLFAVDGMDADVENRTVTLIGKDHDALQRIGDELGGFDFKASYLKADDGLADALIDADPLGIIFDLDMDGAEDSILEILGALHDDSRLLCPLIVLSEKDDIQTRLKAARAYSEYFLGHPVLTTDIVDILDQMVISSTGEDFRILIVDDDSSTARYTQTILQSAGMIAEFITEPLKIMETLEDYSPELILMDLYMPDCNGQELAAVVRQEESFSGVPIVFLSGEADVDKQLVAMRAGGDDFLTKPIKSNHLISSISMRVRRFRMLRSQMVRDSMTGLLNHTTTHEFLDKEVARAHRGKSSLTVAALDIDHFKAVNDTHGHAIGDVVIKSLSRLLKQRLRGTDIIGRMGGEEFAAVLADTTAEQAFGILDKIRQDFAAITHKSDAGNFSVTLSCGIAEYPKHQTSSELLEESDKALHEAKHGGRNRIVLDKN
ncbi:MAG: diguanylate cyclase [Rhodospirillaceae bacterium]|nr:diguanylate cyclase [Rhodospirillaceae bacterium]